MRRPFAAELEERLIRYCRIDTQSDPRSPTAPSTTRQFDLLRPLQEELRQLGAEDVQLTEYGAVLASIPATTAIVAPTLAFLAHIDTTPQLSGAGVKPVVHRNYRGQPIVLPDDPTHVLMPSALPYLAQRLGDDIVTASGQTVLGADGKAGVAIIMTLVRHLLINPHLHHGRLRVCFMPDNEICRSVHPALASDLNADVAYTLAGEARGEIVCETFSADRATVTIRGVASHPGTAKGKLVNALRLAAQVVGMLPRRALTPESTEGREGYVFLVKHEGTAEQATVTIDLRDFELERLREHGRLVKQICAIVQAGEPRATISCAIAAQYRNMRYWLATDIRPVDLAVTACRQIGVIPLHRPTRGRTAGARLTVLGVPTPNLFTGMQESHSPLEWVSIQDMERSTELCLALTRLWSRASNVQPSGPGSF